MRTSQLFATTSKTAPHDADSANARLLSQGGFVSQLAAGIYTYLPFGLRVLNKIKNVIREEMNALGAQEVLMPALTPKEPWTVTGRWDEIDVLFKLEGHGGKEYALGSTHEEIVTPLVQQFVKSYKNLPTSVYQIQDKFRNEPRAKSGLLRGREFSMKDMYSFHLTEADFVQYYERVKEAYLNVYRRCGLEALIVEASGGSFSKYSHEFQVLTPSGEDLVFHCSCGFAQNKEIVEVKEGAHCPRCGDGTVEADKAIEVGNIFPLKSRFTDAFTFKVAGPDGTPQPVLMGCYGIGPSRVMGTIVEVHHDDKGIVWPRGVAPFDVHVVSINGKDPEKVMAAAEQLVKDIEGCGLEVLWDDRTDAAPGEKFADADLIGIPLRLVVSEKTLAKDVVEWKERGSEKSDLIAKNDLVDAVRAWVGLRVA